MIPMKKRNRWWLLPLICLLMAFAVTALSALAEWTGIQISGNESIPRWVMAAVKCADYVLTPMAGGAIVAQMKLRDRWNKALMIVLAANAVFQIVASFNGWMVVIDANNRYTHGPLYMVYIATYLLVIVLTGAEFMVYGSAYRRRNRASLYSVLLLVIVGTGLAAVAVPSFVRCRITRPAAEAV
jgi:hypothetical protein